MVYCGRLAKQIRNIEQTMVVIAMICSGLFAWHNIRNASISYDETITLLTLSGHTIQIGS